jgi:DNA-directed RNA polymerase I subunit RPA1
VAVRSAKNIEKCSVVEHKDPKNPKARYALQTDGVNLESIYALQDELDVNYLITNNIAVILRVYGIEACRAAIMSEVQSVFGSYGIGVNPRHLSLISDFMTCQGSYRPCNRLGIQSSPSPFLKMSYETSTTFLMDATLKGQRDDLQTPSARIVMGRVVEMGTGAFQLLQNIDGLIVNKRPG